MGKKIYSFKDDESMYGAKIKIKGTEKFYTALPWEGDRTTTDKVKLYPIYCEVCSEDKELFPDKILIRKGDICSGYCPCLCSKSKSFSERQLLVIARRLCESKGLVFKGIRTPYKNSKKLKIKVYCPRHNKEDVNVNWSSFVSGYTFGCKSCGKESLIKSKEKSVDELIETFKLHKGCYVIRDTVSQDSKGQFRSWFYFCDVCSNDKYVKLGVCNGTFKVLAGELQKGAKPCRCSPTRKIPFNIAEYNVLEQCKKKGYYFCHWNTEYTDSSTTFTYICSNGHVSESNHHKLVTCGYGCKKCNSYGMYEGRVNETDTLYFIKLISDEEVLIKIGRSFNVRERYREYNKYYKIEELWEWKDKHGVVFNVEQNLHLFFDDFHTKPLHTFGGSEKECFSEIIEGILPTIKNYIEFGAFHARSEEIKI